MPATITIQRRIEWIDTDAAGIYHWTTALRLVEAAEAAMHTELGIVDLTFGRTPRVSVEAEFRQSLRFNDMTDVELSVERLGRTSLGYRFVITGPSGPAVNGRLTICHITHETGRPEPWPDHVRRALEAGSPPSSGS